MKRRDYETLARGLRSVKPLRERGPMSFEVCLGQWRLCCAGIADALATEKPGFDRDLFLINCGVKTS